MKGREDVALLSSQSVTVVPRFKKNSRVIGIEALLPVVASSKKISPYHGADSL